MRIGKRADRHHHVLIVAFFGMKYVASANRTEAKTELRALITRAHEVGGTAGDRERRRKSRKRGKDTAGALLASQAVANACA